MKSIPNSWNRFQQWSDSTLSLFEIQNYPLRHHREGHIIPIAALITHD